MLKKFITISVLLSISYIAIQPLQATPHGNREDLEEEKTSWIRLSNQEINLEDLWTTIGIKRPIPKLFD